MKKNDLKNVQVGITHQVLKSFLQKAKLLFSIANIFLNKYIYARA